MIPFSNRNGKWNQSFVDIWGKYIAGIRGGLKGRRSEADASQSTLQDPIQGRRSEAEDSP